MAMDKWIVLEILRYFLLSKRTAHQEEYSGLLKWGFGCFLCLKIFQDFNVGFYYS